MRLGESDGGEFYSSLDTPLSIPDDVITGITSARYIATATTITTLSLELDVTHPDMAEVTVVLTSPSGTALTIYDGNDAGVANFSRNIGWDAAFNSGNLYSFFGESTDGTWTMNVYDTGAGNSGSLDGWTLRFNEGHDGELFVGNQLTV